MRNINSKYASVVLLSAIVASSVFLASCNKDEGAATLPPADVSALTVSVAEGDENVSLKENAKVDLLAIVADGNVLAKATATADTEGMLTGTESITAVMQDGVQLVAYSPSGLWMIETFNQPVEFRAKIDQTSLENFQSSDLMLSPLTTVADGKASLVMNHAMSKVTVHISDVTGDYDLSNAVLTMNGVHTVVTADLLQNTVTTLEEKTEVVYPYSPSVNVFRASATAIVAPCQVKRGAQLVNLSIDGKQFSYTIPEDAEWQAGKENVYSMRLTYQGLVPVNSTVEDWEDGEELTGPLEEVIKYGVGDYLLSDGSFAKADKLTDEQKAKVVAVVFSEEVSEADKEAGYNAYAMGLESVTGKYGITEGGENVSDYTVAIQDIDGRNNTKALIDAATVAGTSLTGTVFGILSSTLPTEVASGWFVPSFGQMIQILDNLGEAGLTADTEVTPENEKPFYTSTDKSVFSNVNAYVTKAGVSTELLSTTSTSNIYVTSTVNSNKFWCIQTQGGWNWAFGRNAGRDSGYARYLIPCTAIKLP